MNIDRQIHCQRETSDGPVGVRADAVSRRITGEFIEHEHRPAAFRSQLSEAADVELQIRAFHILYLADSIRRFDKIAQ